MIIIYKPFLFGIAEIFAIILSGIYIVWQDKKWNKEGLRYYGKPYTNNVYFNWYTFFLLVLLFISMYITSIYSFVNPLNVCINEIYEWERNLGFLGTSTFFYVRINNQYNLRIDYPGQLNKGECIQIYKVFGEYQKLE